MSDKPAADSVDDAAPLPPGAAGTAPVLEDSTAEKSVSEDPSGWATEWAAGLPGRPGFLIRRLHQIHVALFAEECGGFNVTPVQYSIMSAAALQPGLDQNELAVAVGVDRTTLANVAARLEARGLVRRERTPKDRRLKRVFLTPEGQALLESMARPAARAHQRTIEALSGAERQAFLDSLTRLVLAGNAYGRAPLRMG
ncbi:MarR family transcriptional regulator [Acetobacter sp. TBRC 12305]|uniref:MarR family transcriptional regulator n=1 Tax=Acetobacter garciniae TaxID=2817435 RepID=A0A939KQB5_9PROT|nr:MarR family transcriptional regulator [Acetobacter garciniae]MBO1325164.1 MarR family transcriptional regulator [Acetobacter garciniae]MBX0344865.1 MarR family transcriptional regulator [Acetobacter garciniae]